jgi:response regulator RpfG family c-di-GMP phosphodiesterase
MTTFAVTLDPIRETAQSANCDSQAAYKPSLTRRPVSTEKNQNENLACVMIVDDDELVRSTLRILLEISGGFRVLGFADPLRSIEELERTPVDIVISDYMMPGMNGPELLNRARALQPDSMRILLSGYADKQNGSRALSEAGIYQCLEKPWDNYDVLLVLRSALQEKDLRQRHMERSAS